MASKEFCGFCEDGSSDKDTSSVLKPTVFQALCQIPEILKAAESPVGLNFAEVSTVLL